MVVRQICEELQIQQPKIEIKENLDSLGVYYPNIIRSRKYDAETIIHELIHHVQYSFYNFGDCHGYGFQLAKRKLINCLNKKYNTNFDYSYFPAYK